MTNAADSLHPRFTYGDYVQWAGDDRWELIDGEAWCMSPSPTVRHQRILGALHVALSGFLAGKPCEVFLAPLDVRLPDGDEADEKIRTVLQPDLLVVCKPGMIDERGVRGAPDLVVEILSPSTRSRDMVTKLAVYEKHGVREYWIVDPDANSVAVHRLGPEGKWLPGRVLGQSEVLDSTVLPGFSVPLEGVFA